MGGRDQDHSWPCVDDKRKNMTVKVFEISSSFLHQFLEETETERHPKVINIPSVANERHGK